MPFNQHPAVWSAITLMSGVLTLEPIDSHLSFNKTATSAFFLGQDGIPKRTNREEFHRRFDSGGPVCPVKSRHVQWETVPQG